IPGAPASPASEKARQATSGASYGIAAIARTASRTVHRGTIPFDLADALRPITTRANVAEAALDAVATVADALDDLTRLDAAAPGDAATLLARAADDLARAAEIARRVAMRPVADGR